MKKTLDTFIEKVFRENTLVGTALMALAVWFGGVIAPDKFNWISSSLAPLVMVLILLELYISRTKTTLILDDLKEIRKNTEREFSYQSFHSGEAFDSYLANRFQTAREIKVTHISSTVSNAKSERNYHEIVDRFVRSGKIFHRIFSDTSNKEVFLWIKEDLEKYKDYHYFMHFLENIRVGDIRTLGIMIIDDEEVCIGGGYITGFQNPTISIKEKNIVKFYLDYFAHLRDHSHHIRSGDRIDWEYLDKLIQKQ